MNIEMIINVSEGEESRVAVVCDNVLEELHIERAGTTSLVGNIYKAKVVNIEPAIQAAFIDFGVSRTVFFTSAICIRGIIRGRRKRKKISAAARA